MTRQQRIVLASALTLLAHVPPAVALGAGKSSEKKVVLVELFTSQGCDMCPSAEKNLDQIAMSDRVIPLVFHVDYFNAPWRDPFSDPKFSRREMQYSVIYDKANKLNKPNYLYLTPLLMIDGRVPMLGTDDPKFGKTLPRAREAIRHAQAERAEVAVGLKLKGGDASANRTLEVDLSALGPAMRGREVLVAAVPFTDRATTPVEAGELKGQTYHGRFIARGLEIKPATVSRSGKASVSFSVKPPEGTDMDRDGLVVIVQDDVSGKVHQAALIRWTGKE